MTTAEASGGLPADLVLDSLPRAIVATDLDGGVVRRNRAATSLFGSRCWQVVRPHIGECLVTAEGSVEWDEILAVVSAGGVWSGDLRIKGADGSPITVATINCPITGSDGQVIGMVSVTEDVGERRRFEQEAAAQARHLALALEAGGLGTWRWDIATGETVWDERLERLFGLEPGTFQGSFDAWTALLHPDDVDEAVAEVERAVAERRGYSLEHRVVWPDGTVRWVHARAQVLLDEQGEVTGTMGCVHDTTERMEAQRERERLLDEARQTVERESQQRERLEFVTRMNDVLRTTADLPELMRAVTAVSVPRLGDWCTVHVLPFDRGGEPLVEVAHIDPAMVAYARDLQQRYPFDPDAARGVPAVIRTGETEYYPEITDQVVDELTIDGEQAEIVRSLELRSAIVVPLVKRERVLGAMQFVRARPGRAYSIPIVASSSRPSPAARWRARSNGGSVTGVGPSAHRGGSRSCTCSFVGPTRS